MFHARHERGDADARAHPDLRARAVFKREAAIRPLQRGALPRAQPLVQAAGVVAQRLDEKGDFAPLPVPRRGDGVRVRPFGAAERNKGELPRRVPRPAWRRGQPHAQRLHGRQPVGGLHRGLHPALCAHAAGQHHQRRHAASEHQRRLHPAHRLRPVGKARANHRVIHQRQIRHRQQRVRFGKPAVGKALDERQHDERRAAVKGPFAQRIGQPFLAVEPQLNRIGHLRARPALGAHQPAPAHHPLGAQRQPPVRHRSGQRRNAQPLVQAVGLVQPVQPALGPGRARGQHEDDAHRPNGQHPRPLHGHRAEGEVVKRLRPQRIGQQPQARQAQQNGPEGDADVFHGGKKEKGRRRRPPGQSPERRGFSRLPVKRR